MGMLGKGSVYRGEMIDRRLEGDADNLTHTGLVARVHHHGIVKYELTATGKDYLNKVSAYAQQELGRLIK